MSIPQTILTESFDATVVIKMSGGEAHITLFDMRELLLSGRYGLEVALPHEGARDRLALIFTEKPDGYPTNQPNEN